ncbi:PREDICTED: uncharacterized protein LOC105624374 [Atta cephalotes]|uniref:Heparanase n=1 Tax=Atta cephalotes TaxID=12957 RepID=A0A158NUC0_ATTCE|nr:PREDICTED: uncharacterized protein LOC105624374 [Atta cephalotes]
MKCHRQYVCLLLQVIFFITNCLAENLILNINVKKPIAVTDHAFLSFTLDLARLQYNDFIKNIEKSMNLARGLAPAYIRLGGPQSNFYNFGHSHEINTDRNDMHFGTQWTLIYQWAKNAGLDVIACITPHYIDKEFKTDSTDPRNIAELLSFSDRMGYNISWQLGYECQTRCDLSGKKLGQYVVNFHEILKTFPRYSNSLITGPDIVAYKTVYQQKYLQDYLYSASAALSAITWHPNLDVVSLNNNSISIHYDNMIAEKNELFKIINNAEQKPLWIAESKSQESKHQYLGALIWMRRLGDAAKLGIQVVMRQLTNLSQATPAYWVSLLYKTLVGREVFEIKLQSNNENYVHFYSHCTKSSALYSKGAVTIFGINLTPKTVTASLKGLKIKILHKYILLPQFETTNKMFSEKVSLNNKPLNLINDKNLPNIYPEIIINPDGLELELPSGSIGFWIIPNAKVKACTCSEEEIIENNTVKKLSKRHENNIQQSNQEKEDINHLLKKYKRILLEKKSVMETRNIQHFKVEIENIDNVVTLISKIDAFILYKIISKEPITSEIEDKTKNEREEESSENSQKYNILEKRSRINNLKDYAIKQKLQKIKQKNDDNPVKRGFKSDAFENANHHIDNQHLVQEYNKIKNDNIYRKHSKIDMEKYQSLIQGSERIKRNIKELIKTDLRRDSASEKHSKDDLTNYVNERKMKKNDIRRELRPFNLRTDSDENGFHGFFQQDPVKGFPEDDIFVTTGDSLEQKDKSYDYVKEKDDSNDSLKKKNTQHNQKSTLDYAKDNTWIEEIKDNHCDYMPNKFFENIKLSNMKMKENFENYNDLGEAEFLSKKRNKRDNWEKLRQLFVEEIIQEDEENARDYHYRVIRDSDSPKKHNISVIPIIRVIDTSSENKNVSANVTQFQKDLTEEEYQEIMTGEILSSTSDIDSDYEETDATTKSIITETTLDHKLSETTKPINVTSILGLDNVSKQYHNEKKSTTNLLPVDSKQNKDPREKFTISTINNAQKTILHNEKIQELINKKKTPDNSIYPTITESQNNKKGHNNNCKIELKSTNFLQETTKGIVEQVTTETILLKQAANTTNDNIKSNESITKSKLLQNTEGNQNSESVWMQLEKDANTRKLKNILRNLPRTEGLTRYETSLTKRTELIDKLKEKLYARREKLLHQYQSELTKIADEQKRNLKRREIWERLRGSDDFHQLIDPKFIGILLDDDVTYKDDDVFRNLIDDDEELAEMSKSSEFFDREDNQDCRYSSNTIEDEQESTETTSRSFDQKIFIIDPSTYYGGEPILQEDNVKLPKYQSKIKSQIQYPRWTLRDIHEILTKLKSNKAQHQVSKSQEYIEKLPIKDYNQEHSNSLHVLDKQRQYDLSKKLAAFAQEWLIFLNQRDVNQANNKEADKLNDVHKNLKADNLTKDFKVNQQNQKEYDLSYITLTPIEIKNIFEILDTKNNDDLMELFEILQWNDQYVLEAILNKMTEYLNDKISEEFEYEDSSNLQRENSEIFLDKENYINENKQDITAKDSEIESEKDEQYKITNDEINKFLKIKNQIGSKHGMFLLLPWRNVKIRQQRQIKSEINEDLTEIKREIFKSDKKILQKEMPKLQNHMESAGEFINDSEENFNDTLANEDNHFRNRTFGTTGNVFYTAIMNIKDFFAFLPKISRIFTNF